MQLLARHAVLASGRDCEECRTQVKNYFDRTSLVRYDKIVIDESCLCGDNKSFHAELEKATGRNREILEGFISELGSSGFEKREDFKKLEQGYQSKILHIIAHFLDGFIGIDSAFYNLVDDSHWLPDETAADIKRSPQQYWLFSLECYSMTPSEAALLHK